MSDLDNIAYPLTPAHYKARVIDKVAPREETAAMRLGTIIHRAILEPDTVGDSYAVKPEGFDGRTKAGKEWVLEHSDKVVLSVTEAGCIEGIRIGLKNHPIARRLFTNGAAEQSLFAHDSTGLLRKGRLDYLPRTGNIVPDIKTTEAADQNSFERSVYNYRYYARAAYYLDLCRLCHVDKSAFVFVVVEKQPPYEIAVYQLEDDAVEFGRKTYQRDLTVLRHCIDTDTWPGYSRNIELIGLPQFARRAMEESE